MCLKSCFFQQCKHILLIVSIEHSQMKSLCSTTIKGTHNDENFLYSTWPHSSPSSLSTVPQYAVSLTIGFNTRSNSGFDSGPTSLQREFSRQFSTKSSLTQRGFWLIGLSYLTILAGISAISLTVQTIWLFLQATDTNIIYSIIVSKKFLFPGANSSV